MKIIAANNRANYNYAISNKIEAGIVLTGSEVKSLRINTGSIRGSYIIEQNGELWLSNSFIKKYQNSTDNYYDPNRNRKLLVTKKEFNKINLKSLEEKDKNLKVGEYLIEELPPLDFGRIAVQTAKQVIYSRVKEAEKIIAGFNKSNIDSEKFKTASPVKNKSKLKKNSKK